jgi:hypothetical protein
MLTTPAGFFFGLDGNFLPVLGIALAVDGHESGIELKSATTLGAKIQRFSNE